MQLVAYLKKKIFSSQIRFFSGYTGWSSGQLEKEIEEQSWIVTPGNSEKCTPDKTIRNYGKTLLVKWIENMQFGLTCLKILI